MPSSRGGIICVGSKQLGSELFGFISPQPGAVCEDVSLYFSD